MLCFTFGVAKMSLYSILYTIRSTSRFIVVVVVVVLSLNLGNRGNIGQQMIIVSK